MFFWRWLALSLLLFGTGCHCSCCDWFNPGSAVLQQSRAVRFDPYPDPNAGPAVVGGRPLGYENPPDEAVRAQQWRPPFGGLTQ
jgi:hypothetical protein